MSNKLENCKCLNFYAKNVFIKLLIQEIKHEDSLLLDIPEGTPMYKQTEEFQNNHKDLLNQVKNTTECK